MESAPQESEPLPDEPSADESRWEEENEDITMADGIEEAVAQNEEDERFF